ncbi:MAG TPA: hypothetical protein VFD82_13080 [Planctomycetota bacterium]|nr:hypothetical protein [Planctomycetota bacterium]
MFAMRPRLLCVCLLGHACVSGTQTGAPPDVVELRALGRVDPAVPVDLDTLAPMPTGPQAAPDGVRERSGGGFELTLALADGAPLVLVLYDLRHRDGAGPCYAVQSVAGSGPALELGVIRVSLDGRFLAVPVGDGTSWRVAQAERRDGAFREIASTDTAWKYVDWPALAADGRRLAFWAVDGSPPGGSSATVVERRGTQLAVAARVAAGCYKLWPAFTADGRFVARVLADEACTTERILVDGIASRDYARTGTPVCSPAGLHVAAAVRRARREWLWVDGHELGPFDEVGTPRFVAEDRIGAVVRTGADVSWYVVRPRR